MSDAGLEGPCFHFHPTTGPRDCCCTSRRYHLRTVLVTLVRRHTNG